MFPCRGIVFTVRSASLLARQSYAHLFILPQVSGSITLYRRKLSEAGCSQDRIAKSLRAVRHTWMLVYECRGNVTPDDLDEDIITELECLMRVLTLEFSHWKLRCFG